jgi:hypothetical protein
MGIGVSIFLIAIGAIIKYAVVVDQAMGLNLDVTGVILMIVGLIGLLMSLLFWSSFSPFGARRSAVVDEVHADPHHHVH